MPCIFVRLPNYIIIEVELSNTDTGLKCKEEVCHKLGIYETDFFGLRIKSNKGSYWLHLRRPIFDQISKRNANVELHVRYYVNPAKLQQTATKMMFYHDLKIDIKNNFIHIDEGDRHKASAQIAALEGILPGEIEGRCTALQKYFTYETKAWSPELVWSSKQYLISLEGKQKIEILDSFLRLISQSQGYGTFTWKAKNYYGDESLIKQGVREILLFNTAKNKVESVIPNCRILEVAFREKCIAIKSVLDENNNRDVIFAKFNSSTAAKEIMRCITENQVYFYHSKIPESIMFHEEMQTPLLKLCKKRKLYLFDAERTRKESYSYHWNKIYQVVGSGDTLLQPDDTLVLTDANHSIRTERTPYIKDPGHIKHVSNPFNTVNGTQIRNYPGIDDLDATVRPLEDRIMYTQSDILLTDSTNDSKCSPFMDDACKVCFTYKVRTVFCPCGHSVCCIACSNQMKSCPICRNVIAHKQPIFTA